MELKNIIDEIRHYPGITRKKDIGRVVKILSSMDGDTSSQVVTDFGEDAAAIAHDDHYLMLAAEGMWPQFVKTEPYAAGKAAVMASVNDIGHSTPSIPFHSSGFYLIINIQPALIVH